MLKIAAFDSRQSTEQLEDVLVRLLFDRCEFGLQVYNTIEDVMEIDFERDFCFDIVFIEVSADVLPGIEIAKRIRETGHIRTEIIFTSADDSYALYGYKLRVFDYLVKPIPVKTLAETLDRYFCFNAHDGDSFFTYKVSGAVQRMRLDDVYYFMSSGRKCCIVNKSADSEFYAKLDEVEARLDAQQFVRVHQSYIVQLRYVKSLTREGLMMNNGLYVPVSQKRYGEVKKKFMQYLQIEG